MSIQNIETIQYTEGSGTKIEKRMLPGSFGMLMDLVQKNQYSNPTHSTIRELASNAEDSIKEKQIAKKILTGQANPEDYFVVKEDMENPKYTESAWTPEYYNLDFLDPVDKVEIVYSVNPENSLGFCDKLEILDTGVGLSLRRIIITTMLGQSTKRLNKDLLGAYGFGAKAALSTDCGYYDVFSTYNGKKFAVRCFERHIEDMTPVRNSQFQLNPEEEYEGISLRYVPTTEFNSVKIVIPARRFNKSKFIEAVEEQLLYFNHVQFFILEEGTKKLIPTRAKILLETDYFVISDQDTYRKPHILITPNPKERGSNMVCYGYINFDELEYPQSYGSVGIKCPIYSETIDPKTGNVIVHEGVTVTPSREQVRQGDRATRDYIRKVFVEKVKKEAQNYVADTLSSITDIMEWFKAVREMIKSRAGYFNSRWATISSAADVRENILKILANLVDFNSLSLEFKDTGVQYESSLERIFPGVTIYEIYKKSSKRIFSKRLSRYVDRIEISREKLELTKDLDFQSNLWYAKMPGEYHSHVKDKYILNKHTKFYTFEFDIAVLKNLGINPHIINLLTSLQQYSELVVDDEFMESEEGVEEDIIEAEKLERMSPAERRKVANLTLVTTFNSSGFAYWDTSRTAYWSEGTKMEISIEELENLEGRVYYLFEDEIPILRFIYTFCKPIIEFKNTAKAAFYTDEIKFIKVSRDIAKTLKNAKHISQFFNQIDEGKFIMDDFLKRWNTARIIQKSLPQLKFLRNFAMISKELCDSYKDLEEYVERHYWEESQQMINLLSQKIQNNQGQKLKSSFLGILDKLFELQEFVILQDQEIVEEALGTKFKNLFGITNADVADYDKICQLRKLLEFSENIHYLLNRVSGLCNKNENFSDKEIAAIRDYINSKKQTKL